MKLIELQKKATNKLYRTAMSAYLSQPKYVECNVCKWQGKHFINDVWHTHTICPNCCSDIRHRLLAASLSFTDDFSYKKLVQDKRVLHFAPEAQLKSTLRTYAAKYVTADFLDKRVDLQLDISNMHQIQDGEFDLIIACDVLEHVPNDSNAFKEIYRVLSVGGYAILTVPQKDNLAETFEDSTVVSLEDRERIFGQWDHLRIYGDNFNSIIEIFGFKVTVINKSNFPKEVVNKHILFPPVLSENPLATNYRKIFFAQKVAESKI
ncbi:putative methyltransferase [Nostoc sp. NIES-4103]|nr:putative methyltransferase [Nostoc sp. NIES-4103]